MSSIFAMRDCHRPSDKHILRIARPLAADANAIAKRDIFHWPSGSRGGGYPSGPTGADDAEEFKNRRREIRLP